ncbi:MAG: hypothetical protein SGPRY_004888 [Prymnesium sp.]
MLLFSPLLLAALPSGVEWRTLRPDERNDMERVERLLSSSYVSSDDGSLRVLYSQASLAWRLTPPGTLAPLLLGLSEGEELVGFVCATPSPLRLYGTPLAAVEVSLLCVRPDWREKGVAQLLLAELRRRGAELGVQGAIYTTANPRSRPLLRASTFHRVLRPRELVESGFWQPSPTELQRMEAEGNQPFPHTQQQTDAEGTRHHEFGRDGEGNGPLKNQKIGERGVGDGREPEEWGDVASSPSPSLRLPPLPADLSFRRMKRTDCERCLDLMRRQDEGLLLSHSFSLDLFCHRFVDDGAECAATHSFVATRSAPSGGEVMGFVSFTLVPLITKHGTLLQAQLLGVAAEGMCASSSRQLMLQGLLTAALHEACTCGAHVLNTLTLAEISPELLEPLGFARGDADTYICIEAGVIDAPAKELLPSQVGWLPT